MQISMNQGTGLSERNWLTEGCHLCAWKMMDPICKLPYPTAPPTTLHPHHLLQWLLNKEENMWLFWKITSGLVKLALYWPFRHTVKEPAEDLWGFRVDRIDYHHGLCFSIFLSFAILFSMDIYKMKPIYVNLQKHKCSFQNIRFCATN